MENKQKRTLSPAAGRPRDAGQDEDDRDMLTGNVDVTGIATAADATGGGMTHHANPGGARVETMDEGSRAGGTTGMDAMEAGLTGGAAAEDAPDLNFGLGGRSEGPAGPVRTVAGADDAAGGDAGQTQTKRGER